MERPAEPRTLLGRIHLTFRMLLRACQLVWEASPSLAAVNGLITVAQGVLPAVTLYLSKSIV